MWMENIQILNFCTLEDFFVILVVLRFSQKVQCVLVSIVFIPIASYITNATTPCKNGYEQRTGM